MRLYRWILWIAIGVLAARLLFPAQMEGLTTSTEAKAKIQMYQNKRLYMNIICINTTVVI